MNKNNGLVLISLIAAIAGVVVSYSLLKEDVLSTAKTLFEYFPSKFGVTPASTWEGAIYLGIFVTVTQIVSATIAFQKKFNVWLRVAAGALLVFSIPFDAWTDIVFRSGNFTGDPIVATVTTIAFYTFGSEVMQSLSWIVVLTTWRIGVREGMWAFAKLVEGMKSIKSEWQTISRAARSKEQKDVSARNPEYNDGNSYARPEKRYNAQSAAMTNLPHPTPRPVQAPHPTSNPTYHPVSFASSSTNSKSTKAGEQFPNFIPENYDFGTEE